MPTPVKYDNEVIKEDDNFTYFINNLNSILNKTGEEIAVFLYENLKITMATSVDSKKIDEDLEKEILDNVRKNLKLSGLTIN